MSLLQGLQRLVEGGYERSDALEQSEKNELTVEKYESERRHGADEQDSSFETLVVLVNSQDGAI